MKSNKDDPTAFIFWGIVCCVIMLVSIIAPYSNSSNSEYNPPTDDTYIHAYQRARQEGYSKEESDMVERAVKKYVEQQRTRQ